MPTLKDINSTKDTWEDCLSLSLVASATALAAAPLRESGIRITATICDEIRTVVAHIHTVERPTLREDTQMMLVLLA